MPHKVLMPVRTVAEWGGVHEWALTAVQDFRAHGVEVVVVGQDGTFRDRILAAGGQYHSVVWDKWTDAVGGLSKAGEWDLIFSHGPLARNLGLAVSESTGVPVYHMIHGAYLDQVNDWSPRAESILAASPSVQDFVVRIGKVEPWKVSVVANGVPDSVFDLPYRTLEEKLADGKGTVVTAARLAPDKLHQINPTITLVADLAILRPEIEWTLDVMGDGPLRLDFESRFHEGLKSFANVTVKYSGWVEPEEVPRRMNEAVAACVAGMGGVRALAAGTLALGVGAQGSVGIQVGPNLRAGIWSNFGDHGCPRFTPSDQTQDLKRILATESYDEVVRFARASCQLHRSESFVRSAMFDALGLSSKMMGT